MKEKELLATLGGLGAVMACLVVLGLLYYGGARLKGYVAEVRDLDVSAAFEADEEGGLR